MAASATQLGARAAGLLAASGAVLLARSGRRQLLRRYGFPAVRRGTTLPASLRVASVDLMGPGGAMLRGIWLQGSAGGRRGAALVLHGWGGSALDMLPLAALLQDCDLDVLLLDARGHGRSDDVAFTSMPRFAEDARAGLAWLRGQRDVDPRRLVLVGHSVGAGACLLAARFEPDVVAVVCLSGMADPQAMMRRLLLNASVPRLLTIPMLRVVEHLIGQRFRTFAPLTTLPSLPMPVLLVHGECDTTVPVSEARQLAAAGAHVQLVVLPQVGHVEVSAVPLLGAVLRTFLTQPDRA